MTFRARFLVLFSLAVLAGISLLTWGANRVARQQFEQVDAERRATLAVQFQRELAQRGQEVSFAMQGLADAEGTLRMALDLSRTQADASVYANDARGLAAAHQLDFLDLAAADGTLISSAQARSGYKDDWVTSEQDWNERGAFLQRLDLPDGAELGLLAVRVVSVGVSKLYLIGGRRIDHEFLHTLAVPAGTRALLYRNLDAAFAPEDLAAAEGGVDQPERFAGIIESAEKSLAPSQQTIAWTADPSGTETFNALPLAGRHNEPLGVVLIGSTQRDLFALLDSIRLAALIAALLGILGGILLSSWLSARVTKPLDRITASVRDVTAGNWAARVEIGGSDEAGQLAHAFNEMTKRLPEERSRLVQAERVAAWRDVSQRMTQEMKQSLFPLEVTVGSLARAREESSSRFTAMFQESVGVLRSELGRLKTVATRFSELSKLPQPRLKPVDVNELLREVLKTLEPQFRPFGRPPITPELSFDSGVSKVQGDADLLRKALENLLLHAIDRMPTGGVLTVRTGQSGGIVRIEVSSSGSGAEPATGAGLFAGFRNKQAEGAGLGLPTTQAIVSDHGGKFFAESVPGVGTLYRLEFAVASDAPVRQPVRADAPKRQPKRDLPEIPRVAAVLGTAAAETAPHADAAPAVAAMDASATQPKRDLQEVLQAVAAVSAPGAQTHTGADTALAIALADASIVEPQRDLQGMLQAAAALAEPVAEPAPHAGGTSHVWATDAREAEPKRDLQEMLRDAAALTEFAAEPAGRLDAVPSGMASDVAVAEPQRDLQEMLQAAAALAKSAPEPATSADVAPTVTITNAGAEFTAAEAEPAVRVDVAPAVVASDASELEPQRDPQEMIQAAAVLTKPAAEPAVPAPDLAPHFDAASTIVTLDASVLGSKADLQEFLQAAEAALAALEAPAAALAPPADVAPTVAASDVPAAEAKRDLPEAAEAAAVLAEFTAPAAVVQPSPRVDAAPALAAFDTVAFDHTRSLQEILQAAAPVPSAAEPAPGSDVAPVLAVANVPASDVPASDVPAVDTNDTKSDLPVAPEATAALASPWAGASVTGEYTPAIAPSDAPTTAPKNDSPEATQSAAEETTVPEPESKPEPAPVIPAPLLKPVVARPILSYRG